MPFIRIEQLLMQVDKQTGFSRHFVPIQRHGSKPKNFYKTMISAIIAQATNLGVVSMSASVKDISVNMLRHILHNYIREETLRAANAEIVNHHHRLTMMLFHTFRSFHTNMCCPLEPILSKIGRGGSSQKPTVSRLSITS